MLHDVSEANVIIHAESVERDPFIGGGVLAARKVWEPIDISSPSRGRNGQRATQPFTANDLLQSLAKRFPSTGLERLSVREVVYVRGNIVQRIPELQDDADSPRSRVSPDALHRIAARCTDEGVRIYLRAQVVGPGARIAVTMHARPTIAGRHLTFYVVVHVLPPLHKHYLKAHSVSSQVLLRTMGPFLKSPVTVLRELRAAPMTLLRHIAKDYRTAVHVWRVRRIVHRSKYTYDVGARIPIRVRVCDPQRLTDADKSDAVDCLQRMSRALLDATEEFLREHNIDTADLRRNRSKIIAINYNIEKVSHSYLGNDGIMIVGDFDRSDSSDESDNRGASRDRPESGNPTTG